MSLLDDARRIDTGISTQCDFCTGSSISGHFDGCPVLAMPRIVAALERAQVLCDTVGPLEVDVFGNVHVEDDLIWRLQRAMEF